MKVLYYIQFYNVFVWGDYNRDDVNISDKDTSDDCSNNGDRDGGDINSDSSCSKDDRCNSGCGDDNIDRSCDNNVNGGDGSDRW